MVELRDIGTVQPAQGIDETGTVMRRLYRNRAADPAYQSFINSVKGKICPSCREMRPATVFGAIRKGDRFFLQGQCAPCVAHYKRLRREANPLSEWARAVHHVRRYEAKRSGVPFALTRDVILTMAQETSRCPVLGIDLDYANRNRKRGGTGNSPSLDRVRPECGYVLGNVAIISCRANTLKSDGTILEHAKVLAWLMAYSVSDASDVHHALNTVALMLKPGLRRVA